MVVSIPALTLFFVLPHMVKIDDVVVVELGENLRLHANALPLGGGKAGQVHGVPTEMVNSDNTMK